MLESDIRQLERSVFEFQQPQSFAPVGRQPRPVTLPVAVRRAYGWDVRINCNSGHTVAADHAAAAALARLMENLRAASRTIQLSPGQVLILDNKRSVHGRESYDTDFGGSNRWLQRIYIRSIVGPELPDRPT
jgi:L-asparagine oxygenase